MNEREAYDDPALAARARSWMRSAAPAAAPERLVFDVMDEIARSPRRRWLVPRGLPILAGFARYAALTVVISIGVAAGVIMSRNVDNVGGPSPAPTPTPSLRFLGNVRDDVRLISSDVARAWVVTTGDQLIPVTSDGTAGEPIGLDFRPTDLAAMLRSLAGNGGGETVWVIGSGTDLVSIDPTSGEIFAARGVRGNTVAVGAGAAWVSADGEVIEVEPDLTTLTHYSFETHRGDDPVLVTANALWAADPAGIVGMDLVGGAFTPRIPGSPTALVAAGGLVWAAQGTNLVGLDPGTGAIVRTATLPRSASTIVALATHGDIVWLATAPGTTGPLLVGLDPATGRTVSLTPLPTTPIAIEVVGNQVWTLDEAGHTGRFEPG